MKVKELREQRAKVGAEIRRMADTLGGDKKDFNAEERANWEKVNKDFDDYGRQLETMERADQVMAKLGERRDDRAKPGAEDDWAGKSGGRVGKIERAKLAAAHEEAMQAWFRRQAGKGLTDAQKRACKAVGFNPANRTIEVRLPRRPGGEVRAGLGVSSGAIGGYIVPTTLIANLEKSMVAFTDVRTAGAEVIRTDTGNPMDWPTATDTSNSGELLTENTAVADADAKPTFAKQTWGAYKFSSKMLNVWYELLEDSAFDLNSVLGEMLGERIGRTQATYFTTGTGFSQPAGIVTGSTLGKTAASATAIAADELLDLIHSINPAYRSDPSCAFMMNDGIMLAIRKLKDAENRYLWEQSLQSDKPDRLLGYPVFVNQSMQATVATATKTILFGAMRYFKIRDVNAVRLRRLEERNAEKDQVSFIAFLRSDSAVLNAGGNPIKYLIQA